MCMVLRMVSRDGGMGSSTSAGLAFTTKRLVREYGTDPISINNIYRLRAPSPPQTCMQLSSAPPAISCPYWRPYFKSGKISSWYCLTSGLLYSWRLRLYQCFSLQRNTIDQCMYIVFYFSLHLNSCNFLIYLQFWLELRRWSRRACKGSDCR